MPGREVYETNVGKAYRVVDDKRTYPKQLGTEGSAGTRQNKVGNENQVGRRVLYLLQNTVCKLRVQKN